MKEYLAKFDETIGGTSLKEHSVKTAMVANAILEHKECNNESVKKIALIASIFHDCGKASKSFQEYLTSTDDVESPGHNSVGAVLFNNIVKLNNKEYKNIIRDIIEFHHTPFTKDTYLYDLFPTTTDIANVIEYYRNIVNEVEVLLGIDLGITFVTIDESFEEMFETIKIKQNSSFTHYNANDKIQDSLRKTSYFVSAFDIVRTADILASKVCDFTPLPHETFDINKPEHYDKVRYDEQMMQIKYLLSNNENKFDCLIASTGYGKTAMALVYILKTGGYGCWILPTNDLAITTYNNILKHIKDFSLEDKVSVSLLLSGTWIAGDKKEDANIIVTNVDNFELSTLKNKRKYMGHHRITRTCIFDEFHKYITEAPLMYSFVTSLNARLKFSNTKTLLMSATPIFNNLFVNEKHCNIIKVDNETFNNTRYAISFTDTKNYKCGNLKNEDTLIINNTVSQAQDNYENCDMCMHSLFTDAHKQKKLEYLLENKGKGKVNNESVSATNMANEGHDISFSKGNFVNPTFWDMMQASGRVNRFNQSKTKQINCIHDTGNTQNFTLKHIFKNEAIVNQTFNTLKKIFSDRSEVTNKELFNELMNFNNEPVVKRYIQNCLEKSAESYFDIIFTEGNIIQELDNITAKKVKDGMTLRGNNPTMFITVLQNDGEMSDIITVNEYLFQQGDKDKDIYLSHITSKMVTDAVRYIEKKGEEKLKLYFGKNHKHTLKNMDNGDKINKIKNILIEKSKSSETPFPILCDAKYGYEKGFEINRR
jgi:CRISPR-associated endonuclease Cas3-HD